MTAITWPVVGIDPGGTHTGIVLRDRTTVLAHHIATRRQGEPMGDYLAHVLDLAANLHTRITGYATASSTHIAVEDLNEPIPQMGVTSVRGLIGAAQVLGAVLGRFPAATVVPPGGHGSGILAAYPRELVGAGERNGAGRLRHARSAWDIAQAAIQRARLDEMAGRR